ncbi:MAG: zinc ribbon domain-containing protein [Oscillospiraceae bacterium]|nr:zinc ribbon domain-containing protein [Oscillospiraceae bacterium]
MSRKPTDNPFSGLLICGRCGRAVTVRKRRGGIPVNYVCNKYNQQGCIKDDIREGWGCNPHRVDFEYLNKTAVDYIRQFTEEEDLKGKIFQKLMSERRKTDSAEILRTLKNREKQLKKQINTLYDDRLNGILPDFLFSERSASIKKELESISKQLERHSDEDDEPNIDNLLQKMYADGISSEGINMLFGKILVYEPFEIEPQVMHDYDIDERSFRLLRDEGGLLFVQRRQWNTILH